MSFRIRGLPPATFQHLFGLDNDALRAQGVQRQIVDRKPGYPDRITLTDADVGASVLLLNYTHQPAATPYRASHAIFILEHATEAAEYCDSIPPVLRSRVLSLRAFDVHGMMVDAALTPGAEVESSIERLLQESSVAYVHAHFAQRGCYAARIERYE